MRWIDAAPRRATPKGHYPFIICTASHQRDLLRQPSSAFVAHLHKTPGTPDERFKIWGSFTEAVINAFVFYQVPTIELVSSTPKEAVCQVFEKVNTGGVSLTVFELLTATYAADDFNLRADWADRSASLVRHKLLDRFEATDFLQILTLLSTFDRRRQHLAANPDDDKIPAV